MEKDDEVKGEGNAYNFGARIHDPRLGRFLSVDPLAAKFPWYSSYLFAGNRPISHIDRLGMAEKPANLPNSQTDIMYYGYDQIVDMAKAPGDSWNAQGWARNKDYFWEHWKKTSIGKEALSDWNLNNIATGKPVRVDKQWIAVMKANGKFTEGLKTGLVLEHHHINGGRWATPVASTQHRGAGFTKLLHGMIPNRPGKVHNKTGTFKLRSSKIARGAGKVLGVFGLFADWLGFVNEAAGTPDAYSSIISSGEMNIKYQVGRIYFLQDYDMYMQVTGLADGGTFVEFDLFRNWGTDDQGSYIGVDYLQSRWINTNIMSQDLPEVPWYDTWDKSLGQESGMDDVFHPEG